MEKLIKLVLPLFLGVILAITPARAQENVEKNASDFFNAFISGKSEEAYAYLSESFKEKASKETMMAIYSRFKSMFGEFQSIATVVSMQQNGMNIALLSTKFEHADPMFTVYFNASDKIEGFFNTATNMHSAYKNPVYLGASKFVESEIVVENGTFKLPGTLTVPSNKAKFPIVVLVHGSGPHDRDESFENLKTFKDLAYGLASKGIASIRYDKRTKVYGVNSAPAGSSIDIYSETVNDAVAALQLAKTIKGVDASKVYLLGHSLGAMMGPKIIELTTGIAGFIGVGMPARKFGESLKDQVIYLSSLQTDGATNEWLKEALNVAEQINSAEGERDQQKLIMNAPASYWTVLNKYNQVSIAKKLKLPILILQGEKDYNVNMKDFAIWKTELGNSKNVTLKSYPLLNHSFVETNNAMGRPDDAKTANNVPIYVIDDIANFIIKK